MLNKVSYEAVTNYASFLKTNMWSRKDVESGRYPIAVEGHPYCSPERDLPISVIGGDTDSIFVKFHNATIKEAISWGQKGSDFFSGLFKEGIKMEYEKVWSPYIAIAKKKGIGRLFVMDSETWKLDLKGVETKRRNYCAALKETLLEVFNIILKGADADHGNKQQDSMEQAIEYVRSQLTDLLNGKVPMEKLLISTKLNTTYVQDNLPGLDLVRRMRLRKDFNTPEVGARFQFLYVFRKGVNNQQYQRSEDIDYAKANNLTPDILYYIEKQFNNPILGILKVLDAAKNAKAERLFIEMQSKAKAIQNGQISLEHFLKPVTSHNQTYALKRPLHHKVEPKHKAVKQQKLNFLKLS